MRTKSKKGESQTFNILVDDIGYEVKVTPRMVNDEKRFEISINNGADHIYVWDEQLQSLRALDDETSAIPVTLEKAISDRLMHTIILD